MASRWGQVLQAPLRVCASTTEQPRCRLAAPIPSRWRGRTLVQEAEELSFVRGDTDSYHSIQEQTLTEVLATHEPSRLRVRL